MPDTGSLVDTIADTALWTAAYRAEESERRHPAFRDQFARELAGERGFEIARRVNSSMVRFQVIVRTAVIDHIVQTAISARGVDTVLNLAAGLDARPYRMQLPSNLRWVEADLPHVIEYKSAVLADANPCCQIERHALDLTDLPARTALLDSVNRQASRVLVVTEGLLSYLHESEVATLARDLGSQSHFREWTTELVGAQVLKWGGHTAASELDFTVRFAPAENAAFFAPLGWTEASYFDLFDEGRRYGHDVPLAWIFRLARRVLPAARRTAFERVMGVVLMESRDN